MFFYFLFYFFFFFFFQAEDGIRDHCVTGVQTCALPISSTSMLIGFLSRQYGIPSITLSNIDVDAETLRLVPAPIARKYEVLPVKRIGGTLTLAMADPTNVFALDDVAFMTSLQILPVVAPQAAIRKAIEKHYEAGQASMI